MDDREKDRNPFLKINWPGEISVVVGLILLSLLLSRFKKLEIPSIKIDSRFGLQMLLGFGLLVLPPIVFFISLFLFLFPLVGTLWAYVYLAMILTTIFLPIYLANLLKNTAFQTTSLRYLIPISYLILLVINILTKAFPVLAILNFVVFLIFLAAVGFLAFLKWRVWKRFLESEETL